jgi:hypothetical protein
MTPAPETDQAGADPWDPVEQILNAFGQVDDRDEVIVSAIVQRVRDEARAAEREAEIVLPADTADYWVAAIGGSYQPVVWRKHEASHPTRVAQGLRIAGQRAPECADVIAAMLWQSLMTANREQFAWDRVRSLEAELAAIRARTEDVK